MVAFVCSRPVDRVVLAHMCVSHCDTDVFAPCCACTVALGLLALARASCIFGVRSRGCRSMRLTRVCRQAACCVFARGVACVGARCVACAVQGLRCEFVLVVRDMAGCMRSSVVAGLGACVGVCIMIICTGAL